MSEARCRDLPKVLFFGPAGEQLHEKRRREREAKRVCVLCPVREPCRAAGRLRGEFGIWGGESEEERLRAGFPPRFLQTGLVKVAQELRDVG